MGTVEPATADTEEYDEYLALSDCEFDSALRPSISWDPLEQIKYLPYHFVYNESVPFKAPLRQLFVPGQEIEVSISSYDRSVTTHLINPNLYTIELKHADFRWTIKKRYKHFLNLHQQLRLFKAGLNIPFPSKLHREQRASFRNQVNQNGETKSTRNLPRFPARPEALVPYEKIDERVLQLEEYLRNLLKINLYRNHHETAEFLEVSEFSFIAAFGDKGREGMVKKRTRSSAPGRTGWNCCGCCDTGICVRCHFICGDICSSWRTRWLILKESFVAYVRPKDGRVKAVILFDSGFDVSSGVFATGHRRGLAITNLTRQIIISCPTRRTARDWQFSIKEMMRKAGGDFIQRNRYFSFSPVRQSVSAAWFVDGRSYMSAVATALEQATQEIFIADWWLSPEIYMKRPSLKGDYWRLDVILKRKASLGVKVFVLLYKEVELAIGINSYYSKQQLVNGNPNIKVLRHPDHAKAGVFLWAHHEKMVVIDQSIAFVGGIDLCYGRWDDYMHRLTDQGNGVRSGEQNGSIHSLARATNALNDSIMAITQTTLESTPSKKISVSEECIMQPTPDNIKCNTPELERKSILETMRSRGRELMNLWSFSSEDESDLADDTIDAEAAEKRTISTMVSVVSPAANVEPEDDYTGDVVASGKLWVGKDYTNFIFKDFENLDQPFQDLVDRNKTPRMPWHDVGVAVKGSAARDLARHFIQRWNAVKLEKSKLNPQYPYLLPKAYEQYSKIMLPGIRFCKVSCQAVRSVSHWSGGFIDSEIWEGSIHEAIVDAIAKSRHFVYIENQFFISHNSPQVKNHVANALFRRIMRAHREKSVFRVYVVLPLLPGFEGELGTPSGTALHAITHWNYVSICRGKDSLLVRLRDAGVSNPHDYITFHGLRNHSTLNSYPITELIYVHSKLLIVDDRLVICGSANINDRSLLGKRDSEIAVVIEDEEYKNGFINGQHFLSGRMAGTLRRYLFREHLGLLGNPEPEWDVSDPTSDEFYHNIWKATARRNTEIYDSVFSCLPRDEVRCFKDLKTERTPFYLRDPEAAAEKLKDIKGHLVSFPLEFLADEVLTPNPSSVQGMMPTSLWT
ncbi:Phospholipase D Active site motif [Nesidiocoris tenuis]|uniref:Phospholipase n=1 Tax=Nesidiocoris tenuis TaxID=355587 RepID=A0ABN7B302_9HEMI|nr:Phospholipase D Active site motif [Nesidiocoris tenuis]